MNIHVLFSCSIFAASTSQEAETDPYQSGADLAPCANEDSKDPAAEDEDLEVLSFVPAPKSKVHELQMELINLQREISKRLSKGF